MPRTRTFIATLVAAAVTGVGAGTLLHVLDDGGQPQGPDAAHRSAGAPGTTSPQTASTSARPASTAGPKPSDGPSTRPSTLTNTALLDAADFSAGYLSRPVSLTTGTGPGPSPLHVCQTQDPSRSAGLTSMVHSQGSALNLRVGQWAMGFSTSQTLDPVLGQISNWREDCYEYFTRTGEGADNSTVVQVPIDRQFQGAYWTTDWRAKNGAVHTSLVAWVRDADHLSVISLDGEPMLIKQVKPELLLERAAQRLR